MEGTPQPAWGVPGWGELSRALSSSGEDRPWEAGTAEFLECYGVLHLVTDRRHHSLPRDREGGCLSPGPALGRPFPWTSLPAGPCQVALLAVSCTSAAVAPGSSACPQDRHLALNLGPGVRVSRDPFRKGAVKFPCHGWALSGQVVCAECPQEPVPTAHTPSLSAC